MFPWQSKLHGAPEQPPTATIIRQIPQVLQGILWTRMVWTRIAMQWERWVLHRVQVVRVDLAVARRVVAEGLRGKDRGMCRCRSGIVCRKARWSTSDPGETTENVLGAPIAGSTQVYRPWKSRAKTSNSVSPFTVYFYIEKWAFHIETRLFHIETSLSRWKTYFDRWQIDNSITSGAGHFVAFKGFRERLHGHNYTVLGVGAALQYIICTGLSCHGF